MRSLDYTFSHVWNLRSNSSYKPSDKISNKVSTLNVGQFSAS